MVGIPSNPLPRFAAHNMTVDSTGVGETIREGCSCLPSSPAVPQRLYKEYHLVDIWTSVYP